MMSADVFGELCKEKTEEEIKDIKAYLLALGLAVETSKGQIFVPCLASDINKVWIFAYSCFNLYYNIFQGQSLADPDCEISASFRNKIFSIAVYEQLICKLIKKGACLHYVYCQKIGNIL